MDQVRHLIVGAGVTGLAYANFIDSDDYLILEKDAEIGGYCKTIRKDGFVWDYSGHFFHFRHSEIESYLRQRMPSDEIKTVTKVARILYRDDLIDFPFQKNIHQLPKEEFIDCLYDLYFREERPAENFADMLYTKFGRGIAEKFLIPYNEKLYACDLSELDEDAMGRFFPHADVADIIRNFRHPDERSYNATFTYPRGGAIEYIEALSSEVDEERVSLEEALTRVDLERKVAKTSSGREIAFEYLISSAPFDRLLKMAGVSHNEEIFTSNKVVVFNLGFDRKGWEGVHWIYVPERRYAFYRVGFYDNIFDTDRMSLYVEIGRRTGEPVDTDALREQVLADLEAADIVDDHELVAWHSVVLDPAYVHITEQSTAAVERYRKLLNARGVYPVGRYGGWTYCSIEDNIVEARELAWMFNELHGEGGQGPQ